MKTTKNNIIKQSWKAICYVLKREKSGRQYAICRFAVALVGALLPLIVVVLPGRIINDLSAATIDWSKLYFDVAVLTVYPLLWYILKTLLNIRITRAASEFGIHSNELILNHLAKIDFEDLETPQIQQLRERADVAMGRLLSVIDIVCGFLGSLIGFVSISALISTLNPFIIVLVVLLVFCNSLSAKWIQRKSRESKLIADRLNRKRMTYSYAFDDLWFAKEMRLFQSQHFLIKKMSDNELETNKNHMEYQKKEGLANVVPIITSMIQGILVYVYLIYLVIETGLPVGSMTIYISAVASLYNSINSLSNHYLSLKKMQYDFNDLNSFFSLELRQFNTGKRQIGSTIDSIEFRNVSFKYPGSERFALCNVNLKISSKERLCIVGENGAGKSTFINLLTRMYFPTSGEILLNGINIYEYDYLDYISKFSPVFQDFCKYEFEVKNNICLCERIDDQKYNDVIKLSSLTALIEKLPKKGDTFIGKWVDPEGFEPSGGEAQKIAIARALYHSGDVYILDEPTASLDPNAEYEIYEQFHSMIKDKIAIFVTHRLSAVQLADRVAVFDRGQIIEYGTHSELYLKGGIYAKMFDKQAQFYREGLNDANGNDANQ